MNLRKFALATLAATFLYVGCDNSNPFAAQLPTSNDTFTIFALTGTPPAYPSGLNLYGRTPARVDGNAAFDIAFDIGKDGNAIIYPVKLVVSSIGGDRAVGLKLVPGKFDSVTIAPSGTYQKDSAIVAAPGQVVVLEINRAGSGDVCSLSLSPNIYGKVSVDSINVATRTLTVTSVMDPNCGFRSFAEGIPTK